MSTFLQLCNDVARETGTLGQDLTTVVGATGRGRKIVAWTRQAWEMIQRQRSDWNFRQRQFDDVLTIGETTYSPADLGIDNFGRWMPQRGDRAYPFSLYDVTIGRSDETVLNVLPIRDWLSQYDLGSPESTRPTYVSIDPEENLRLGPPPDAAYAIRGWYERSIQSMALDADEPFIHEDMHQIIVWRACMLAGDDDESEFESVTSGANFGQMMGQMIARYVDQVEL